MAYKLSAQDQHIIMVISEFNLNITERLLKGAVNAYLHYDGLKKKLTVFRVPGAFEIPATVKKVANKLNPDAIVTLGAVIKGETKHFNFN